jgi:SAM-dependent methyltransferase
VSCRDEADEVARRYGRRAAADDRYSPLRADVMATLQERQRVLRALLLRHGGDDPAALRLVEVGCGAGGNLLELLQLGFRPEHLQGVELLPERLALARERLPSALRLHAGDACTLALPEGSQDIVYAATVFSSLLDDIYQQRLADAMWRWLRPGGAVLWYDFTVDNPANRDVRGVNLRRLQALFPQGPIDARRVTLAPPIARRVVRLHPALYTVFNTVPLLRTHVLAWVTKPLR